MPHRSATAESRCEATLSLEQAAARPWDVVVAGAGPAGAVCALVLANRGVAVLLVDKCEFPRDKVCGSCLNGAALSALCAAGLHDQPAALGAVRLTGMRIRAGNREALLRLPKSVAVSRRALDVSLVRAAIAAGAEFLPSVEATLDRQSDGARAVRLRDGTAGARATTQVAVAADGLAGGFLKEFDGLTPTIADYAPLGFGAIVEEPSDFFPAGTIFMGCTPRGYVGVVRLEDGRLDIALALDRGAAKSAGGTSAAAVAVLRESGLPCPASIAGASFRGTPLLTRSRACVAGAGLVVIGDAAGYVEPLTGEGMAWALQQAILAAALIHESILRRDPGHTRHWQEQHARFFRGRRNACRLASWMRRRFQLGSLVVGLLGHVPALAAPWIRSIDRVSPEVSRSIAT